MSSRGRRKVSQRKSSNYTDDDLKEQKVEEAEESSTSSSQNNEFPMVRVERLERGFQINVYSEKNSPGMLVSVLEAFEQLGLDVLDARVSCEHSFHLEAVGGSQFSEERIDAQVVKQTVVQAINNVID